MTAPNTAEYLGTTLSYEADSEVENSKIKSHSWKKPTEIILDKKRKSMKGNNLHCMRHS